MKQILLVDDDEDFRESLKEVLENRGFAVTAATDGNEGRSRLESQGYDLVISDVLMPENDGIELLVLVRSKWPGTRFLSISAGGRLGAQDCLAMCDRLGADGTLEKPFTAEEITAMIDKLLG
ncbi:MAG: response regulator [Gemmatimonadetes bacterium]|nr:response regulator [Gemmatimonadota bacterium]